MGKPAKKSAAVTITLLPTEEGDEKISMAVVMKRAAGRVDLAALNIDYLRPKRSQTGGLILEIPGENSAPRADALASKLSEAMGDTKVRISRPTMWAEIRIHNLVESATVEQVAEAVAKAGGCQAGQIRVGELKQSSSGLLGAWLRVPQAAAHKVAALGKIIVGWTAARVELLQSRPLQCHRCLKYGHVRQRCPPSRRTPPCRGERAHFLKPFGVDGSAKSAQHPLRKVQEEPGDSFRDKVHACTDRVPIAGRGWRP
jgi:hypothetical protein